MKKQEIIKRLKNNEKKRLAWQVGKSCPPCVPLKFLYYEYEWLISLLKNLDTTRVHVKKKKGARVHRTEYSVL